MCETHDNKDIVPSSENDEDVVLKKTFESLTGCDIISISVGDDIYKYEGGGLFLSIKDSKGVQVDLIFEFNSRGMWLFDMH